LFYVVDGFLDILLPVKETGKDNLPKPKASQPLEDNESWRASSLQPSNPQQKLLFTVKPGGIAGYLGKCSQAANL
jgi:lysophospholipid hydrolase